MNWRTDYQVSPAFRVDLPFTCLNDKAKKHVGLDVVRFRHPRVFVGTYQHMIRARTHWRRNDRMHGERLTASPISRSNDTATRRRRH
jgi:hypothetical protein